MWSPDFVSSSPRRGSTRTTRCGAWAAQVAAFIDAPGSDLDLPLQVQGTEMEQRVWQALREIPLGATVSYGEVAKRIGIGVTAQEVAQACAANVLAVAIPCHRVIRSDGRLGGYRWGYGRKRALLQREARAVETHARAELEVATLSTSF